MTPVTFQSRFGLGDRVIVDGCRSVVAVVVALTFRHLDHEVQISWWNEGSLNHDWVSASRLEPAP
jgi:hypothetical protein